MNFLPIFERADQLLQGVLVTVQLSVGAMAIGGCLAMLCAIGKTRGPAPIRHAIDLYIEVVRNTPFLIQIFFIYFGLPTMGIRFSPNLAALLALTINVGAYATEIVRAGIESINKGQVEAGAALGLRPIQIFRHVIFVPAMRAIYPALTSQFVYLMLTSSVVSVISATDLSAAGNDIQSQTFASFEVYIVVTIIYFILSTGLSVAFSLIERWAFSYPLSR